MSAAGRALRDRHVWPRRLTAQSSGVLSFVHPAFDSAPACVDGCEQWVEIQRLLGVARSEVRRDPQLAQLRSYGRYRPAASDIRETGFGKPQPSRVAQRFAIRGVSPLNRLAKKVECFGGSHDDEAGRREP